ncbi:ABC transporter permease subunit [Romboutsia maritimum]|uniref:ABC transporter permease subunit n=1 Tax=Romboutsia maritimum TaxID=2020948 RepID=A0A371IT80_9FIRM|nr:ABC transporter permease subunit [Romboutsia maritimum]RDY23697.1 ABC transporter permease subunit [Romboutsia maritimum]
MKIKFNKFVIDMILIAFIVPFIVLVLWGFTNSWPFPYILPQQYSLRGIEYILNVSNLKMIFNSICLSIIVVLITLIISIPAAKSITLYNFKGKRFFEVLILSPIIIPLISVAMGIHIVFIQLSIANNIFGVIIINILPCIPYAVRIIADVYRIVGDKFEMQGKVLGANSFNNFKYITLPLILPGIIGASSMCFIISFSQYFLTMLIGGGSVITYPMVMFPYIQSGDRTIGSLYSLLFLIVSLIVLLLVERKINKHYKIIDEKNFFSK